MKIHAIDPDGPTPAELQQRIGADRGGQPYLLFRDGAGAQQIFSLAQAPAQLTIGRARGCDVCLDWDHGVSRAHARLERLAGSEWTLIDDGLSRNGSSVNGERLHQRRRLSDGDTLRFGETAVVYRSPAHDTQLTVAVASGSGVVALTPAQRRVLVALCRPYRDGARFAKPASNADIARELVLSVDAVKTQLRALFERFEIEPLARDAKRAQLARRALESETISQRDLIDG